MSEQGFSGHCYCGSVKFEISGASDWIGHCHCQSCRRASGSVMTTFAGFKRDQVVFTGAMPNRYSTGDGVTRSFCGLCGSPVSYEYTGHDDEIHMQLGLFDDLEPMKPRNHCFREEKPSWLHADENLPDSSWERKN